MGERHIDNFVINYCLRHSWLSKQKQNNVILCLPTETLSWLDNEVLQPIKTTVRKDLHQPHKLRLILLPGHMEHIPHWGLACAELETMTVWYDDGMKVAPPAQLCSQISKLVMLVADIFPPVKSFNSNVSTLLFSSQYKRMHMLRQRLDDKTAGGRGCGMGVILMAQQIINEGNLPPQQISWTFDESNHYQKKLMVDILT